MDEYKLQDIWKKNLREFNDVMRLDSIIIRAMQEAVKEDRKQQLILSVVSQRSELLLAYNEYVNKWLENTGCALWDEDVDDFLANNCG